MRIFATISLVLTMACASTEPGSTTEATVGPPETTVAAVPAATTTEPAASASSSEMAARPVEGPEYDVFLAAVADTLGGTRFAELPFEDPEVFVATGLLLCEELEQGASANDVVADYLGELAGDDPALADDDQLILAGALLGAAETALCPAAVE